MRKGHETFKEKMMLSLTCKPVLWLAPVCARDIYAAYAQGMNYQVGCVGCLQQETEL